MFTGLIEEIGVIAHIDEVGDGRTFTISAAAVMDDLQIDHSIAVNGCCLTVTHRTDSGFRVTAVAETLRKTTLGGLAAGNRVNLERAVRLADRMGGHMVQGHVDAVGHIERIDRNDQGWEVWVSYPAPFGKWLIPVGSVCVNGISLTVADLQKDRFKIAVIPHTLQVTTLGEASVGDAVNLEFDMIAKYLERLTVTINNPG